MMWILTIVFTIIGGILYRFGGLGNEHNNFPILKDLPGWLFKKITRRAGCTFLYLLWVLFFYQGAPWYMYVISSGIFFGMITTYWDFITGKDNFYLHGMGIAMAVLPLVFFTGMWWQFALRCLTLSMFMGVWCQVFGDDWVEELGRGSSIFISLPLLLCC